LNSFESVSQSPSNAHAYRLCVFNDPSDPAAFATFICLLSCDQLSLVVYISFWSSVKNQKIFYLIFDSAFTATPLLFSAFQRRAAVLSGALQYMPDFGLPSNLTRNFFEVVNRARGLRPGVGIVLLICSGCSER